MFFFGPKKDKYYDIAQKLFTSLADAAQPEWKNRILIQRDLMKRAKRANEDSALALSFKSLPDDARIMPKHPQVLEVPFASVRLSKDGKEFFADISVSPDGAIGTIQFTQHYLAENGFDVLGVDFFPNLFNSFQCPVNDFWRGHKSGCPSGFNTKVLDEVRKIGQRRFIIQFFQLFP